MSPINIKVFADLGSTDKLNDRGEPIRMICLMMRTAY